MDKYLNKCVNGWVLFLTFCEFVIFSIFTSILLNNFIGKWSAVWVVIICIIGVFTLILLLYSEIWE